MVEYYRLCWDLGCESGEYKSYLFLAYISFSHVYDGG
jgi:hypothetical protein